MNLDVFLQAPWVVQLHASCAILALLVGLMQWFGPKGLLPHRMLGVLFVALILVVVVTALFIRNIFDGWFSPVHLFIPLALVGLWGLVRGYVRKDAHRHGHAAKGLLFGALLIPGIFAFIPGRLMFAVVFGN